MVASGKRTRGPNKQRPWSRDADDRVSVLRLALDLSDPAQRHRLEALFSDAFADAIAAILASFVVLPETGNPASARVDYESSARAIDEIRRSLRSAYQGWQDTLSESIDLSARDGICVRWRTSIPGSVRVARRTAGTASCTTRDETGLRQATLERARMRTGMSCRYGPPWSYLRDKS